MRLLVVVALVGCNRGPEVGPPDSHGIKDTVFGVFNDPFDTEADGESLHLGIGAPAPSLQLIGTDFQAIERRIRADYDRQELLAQLQVDPRLDVDGEMLVRFVVGRPAILGIVDYKLVRRAGVTTATANDVPIPFKPGFKHLHIVVGASGTSFGADGNIVFHQAGERITTDEIYVSIGGMSRSATSAAPAGPLFVDNLVVYRGQPPEITDR